MVKRLVVQQPSGTAVKQACANPARPQVLADPEVAHYFEGVDMKKQKSKQVGVVWVGGGGGAGAGLGSQTRGGGVELHFPALPWAAVRGLLQICLQSLQG